MFENIIGHRDIVGSLRDELPHDRFPRSALFFGPPCQGKLSTALEVARVLTCSRGGGDWACACPPCRLQKELAYPHTVLLGPRAADVEIAACADALIRSRRPASLYLFVRAVRKLTRRFDAVLADPDDARMKGAPERVARLEELLSEISPGEQLPPEKKLNGVLEQIIAAAAALATQLRSDGVTVGQVRRLGAWAHLTASGAKKVAIIENADRMQDSARNALLKLLEEPPESVHLLLLTTRRAAIMPTILSRLRPYSFAERSAEEEKEVLEKIFRVQSSEFRSLREFFLAWKEINPEKIAALARRFLDRIGAEDGVDILAELVEIFPERRGQGARGLRESALSFLEELASQFRALLRDERATIATLEGWGNALREAHGRIEIYNIAPQAAIESLYYRMRDAARADPARADSVPASGGPEESH